jgi:hypothetical protein
MTTKRKYLAIYDDWELDYRIVFSRKPERAACRADSPRDLAREARKAGIAADQIRNDIPYPKDVAFQRAMTAPCEMTAAETLAHLQNVLGELQRQERERKSQASRSGDKLGAVKAHYRAEGLTQALQEINRLQENNQ